MIIDTESHVFYRLFPQETNPGRSYALRASWHEYSGDLFAAEMHRAGVDGSFLMSYDGQDMERWLVTEGGTAEDFIGGRKYTLSAVRKYPERFLWFATLKDPKNPRAVEQAREDLDYGALGLKILPPYLGMAADDPALMAVYRVCAERNRRIVLSFEDTRPPETPTVTEYFEQLAGMVTEFPDLLVQLNHAGGGDPADPATDPLAPGAEIVFRTANEHPNVFLSTAWLGKNWPDGSEYPFETYLARLSKLYENVDPKQLMWATDWPWLEEFMNYPQAVTSVTRHATFFSPQDLDLFMGGNAERFVADLLAEYRRAPLFAHTGKEQSE